MVQNLTIKQRKFLRAYIELGNLTEAVIRAGYKVKDRDNASIIGWENLRKLRPHIASILEMRGIDDVRLSKVMDDGLEATKIEMVKDAEGNQKFGMVTDHFIRHKYMETALKVKGGFAPEKKVLTGEDGGPIRVKVFAADFGLNGEIENGNGNDQAEALHAEEK